MLKVLRYERQFISKLKQVVEYLRSACSNQPQFGCLAEAKPHYLSCLFLNNFLWSVISSKAVYDAIIIEEVSVVCKCLTPRHLHLPWLTSEPPDDDRLREASHQAACQNSLQFVVHIPALLCHQVCHVVLRQLVATAVHLLTGGAGIAGAKGSYFSGLHTPSRQAKVKSGETAGHHLRCDNTNEYAWSLSGSGR